MRWQRSADPGHIRDYPVAHPSDNLTVATGHIRVCVGYDTARVPGVYRPAGSMLPPLTDEEQQARLAVLQRIFASFELLSDGKQIA